MNKIKQILLIDDDSITNFITKSLVLKSGAAEEIVIAINGKEALLILTELCASQQHCPELIFLDLNMPVMNGFEFLEEYQKLEFVNKASVALFLLTTSSHTKDLEKAEKYKVSGVLTKPLTKEKLQVVLESLPS